MVPVSLAAPMAHLLEREVWRQNGGTIIYTHCISCSRLNMRWTSETCLGEVWSKSFKRINCDLNKVIYGMKQHGSSTNTHAA